MLSRGFFAQLKKGILEMLVLKLIEREQQYGYQLKHMLFSRSNGAISIKDGTLYPILHRLEKAQLIECILVTSNSKNVTCKHYRITEEGERVVDSMQEEWDEFNNCVRSIMET